MIGKNGQLFFLKCRLLSDSPDSDYDPGELAAQRLAESGEMSQDQILELIQAQKLAEGDPDSEDDLLEPVCLARTSNRIGGGGKGGNCFGSPPVFPDGIFSNQKSRLG
jgi:hypothetical protein